MFHANNDASWITCVNFVNIKDAKNKGTDKLLTI